MKVVRDDDTLRFGAIEVRPCEGLVTVDSAAIILSVREFGLLRALVERGGHVVSRAELYQRVWGAELRNGDRSVDVYIHKLRVKLDDAAPERIRIHTHVGFGYRLEDAGVDPRVQGAETDAARTPPTRESRGPDGDERAP